jgi:hypothetical protein
MPALKKTLYTIELQDPDTGFWHAAKTFIKDESNPNGDQDAEDYRVDQIRQGIPTERIRIMDSKFNFSVSAP